MDVHYIKQRLLQFIPMPSDKEIELLYYNGTNILKGYYEVLQEIEKSKAEFGSKEVEEIIPDLIRTFGIDEGGEVFWTTVHLIESFRFICDIFPAIRTECNGMYPGARKWGCLLLARLSDPRDIPILIQCLDDPFPQVRYEALHGLTYYSDPSLLKNYQAKIEHFSLDENVNMQDVAKELLKKLGNCSKM